MVDAGPYHQGDHVPAQEIDQGVAIEVGGQRVGTELTAAPPPGPISTSSSTLTAPTKPC